jgi:hypothetical protein
MLNPSRSAVIATTAIIAVSFIGVAVLLVVSLLAITHVTPIPDSAINPPLYPGAEEVNVTDQQNPHDSKAYYSKEIDYTVAARPEDVEAFYQEALLKDGWYRPIASDQLSTGIAFEWHQAGIDGPTDTAFRETIITEAVDTKSTKVRVTVVRFDPR